MPHQSNVASSSTTSGYTRSNVCDYEKLEVNYSKKMNFLLTNPPYKKMDKFEYLHFFKKIEKTDHKYVII